MKVNRDQFTGALIVLLGILVFISISGYRVPFTATYPGPKALPGLAGIGFVICGAGIFLNGCRKAASDAKPFLSKEGWIRLAISLGMLILYVVGMNFLGFWIPTVLFCFACSTYYAVGYKTTLVQRLIFSVAVTVVMYLVYHTAFGYRLPAGFFG